MRIFPKTKAEWIALVLFPFKAYILLAWPLLILFSVFFWHTLRLTGTGGSAFTVGEGYVLCIAVLLVGACIQYFVSGLLDSLITLGFAVAPVLLCYLST